MILALRPRVVAALLGFFSILPAPVAAGMTPEEVKAFEGYKARADQGDGMAQFELACCYRHGKGVAKDFVEAVRWFRRAADQGDAAAQYNLGACYFNGEGVPKDEVEAVKWCR